MSASQGPRRGRRLVLGAALLALVFAGSAAGADTPGGGSSTAIADGRTTDAPVNRAAPREPGPGFGIPTLPIYANPPDRAPQAYDGRIGRTVVDVGRARLAVTVPPVTALSYQHACSVFDQGGLRLQFCCPDQVEVADCPADDVVNAPSSADGAFWLHTEGPVWVASPPGGRTRFGIFPQVGIAALVFGAIPVRVTLHVTQPLARGGLVEPLHLDYLGTLSPLPGGTIVAGYPSGAPAGQGDFVQHASLRGRVELRLSDVFVDGKALDVGPACRARTPAAIEARSPRGFYNSLDPIAGRRGLPGSFQPINSANAGSFAGTVSVPPFTGCRDETKDLSPLLTALVSSAANQLDIVFASPFLKCTDRNNTVPCPAFPSVAADDSQRRSARQRRAIDRVLDSVPVSRRQALRQLVG